MAKKKAFPGMVYIAWNTETDEPFLVAEDNAQAHANLGENIRVACYKLEQVVTVETKIELRSAAR